MRANLAKVLDAFRRGMPSGTLGDSISCDGGAVYSYHTCLVARSGDRLLFNATKYSPTTTRQQSSLRAALGPFAHEVDDVPRGTLAMALLWEHFDAVNA